MQIGPVSRKLQTLLYFVTLLHLGCHQSPDAQPPPGEPANNQAEEVDKSTKKLSRTERELAAIDQLAEAGNVDKAAAALVKMRMKGTNFNADEAAAYRDSLSLVYDQALELNESGDARAKNALKILQSNGAF